MGDYIVFSFSFSNKNVKFALIKLTEFQKHVLKSVLQTKRIIKYH